MLANNAADYRHSSAMYYFGARIYDSRASRWLSIDPLAYKYPFTNPYNFVLNSPIFHVDPDGKEVYAYDQKSKELTLKTMKHMFGKSMDWSFDDNHKLIYTGNTDKLSTRQQVLFNYFSKTVLATQTPIIVKTNKDFIFVAAGENYKPVILDLGKSKAGGMTIYKPIPKGLDRHPGTGFVGVKLGSPEVEIAISRKATNEGVGAYLENGQVSQMSPEEIIEHEFGHAIMEIMLKEMGGNFEGTDFNMLSSQQQDDFSTRVSNTTRADKNKKLESGTGQHGRDDTTTPPKSDVAPLK